MPSHDLEATLSELPAMRVSAQQDEADAMSGMRVLASHNDCMVGLVHFSGSTPWERHPDDELLHILRGEVEVQILPERGAGESQRVRAGSICVVPRGLWHRQRASAAVALLFVTSERGNEVSRREDPRQP
jgi:quercetin dioxygenase-like cupin family protein